MTCGHNPTITSPHQDIPDRHSVIITIDAITATGAGILGTTNNATT